MSVALGFVLGLLSGVALSFLLAFTEPVQRLVKRKGRTVFREDPVDVHVQTDQAVIWAGLPPWISGRYFFDDALPKATPPDACVDWTKWSREHGGRPCGEFELMITIQAKLDVAVVVDTPIVRVVTRREVDGVTATCVAVGGPSVSPRRFQVSLDASDPPDIVFNDEGMEPGTLAGFSLTKGEVERFHIWANATGQHELEWSLELPMIVNGDEVRMDLGTFVAVGGGAASSEFLWQGDDWMPYETPTYE